MNKRLNPAELTGVIQAIPSKSHAHRLLIAQKITDLQGEPAPKRFKVPAFSKDVKATMDCLKHLDDEVPLLDCGESASTLRFLMPLAMLLKERVVFRGAGKLPERPLDPFIKQMGKHGCTFNMSMEIDKETSATREICEITGRLKGGNFRIPGDVSSQFITGLMFALPLMKRKSNIILTTPLESAGYVNMTLSVLKEFGVTVNVEETDDGLPKYVIPGRQVFREPLTQYLDGDWSNAAFWLACGALGQGVTVKGLSMISNQPDMAIMDILASMGADIYRDIDYVTARNNGRLRAMDIDVSQIPDLMPVLAVLMSVADGVSMITGAERLKLKESNRLKAICDNLNALGADVTYGGNSLSITGVPRLAGGTVDSLGDHRIAMAMAVASTVCDGKVTIRNADAVSKSYPGFFKDFTKLSKNKR